MKLTLTLFLLGLISSSLAFYTSKKLQPFVVDTSFLESTHNAKKPSFSQLISLMQQSTDLTQINAFLDGLSKSLSEEKVAQSAIFGQILTNCADEDAFRRGAILEGSRAASASQAQLDLCTVQKNQAQTFKELATNALSIYQAQLEQLDAARVDAIALYNVRKQRLNDVQESIVATQEYLDEVEAAAAGLVAAPALVQITNKLLKSTIKTGHSHLVLPVYTRLLQMHGKQALNADNLQQVRTLLQELLKNAQDSLTNLAAQENQDEQNYNTSRQDLKDLISKLNEQVSSSQEHLQRTSDCISQENSILALANDKVKRNSDLLEQGHNVCELSKEEFRQADNARTKQQNIISAIKAALVRLQQDYENQQAPQAASFIDLKVL